MAIKGEYTICFTDVSYERASVRLREVLNRHGAAAAITGGTVVGAESLSEGASFVRFHVNDLELNDAAVEDIQGLMNFVAIRPGWFG